ncbi:MAG TPA: hypothetical protein VEA80_06500 [Vitreimonas sp.]|uniref:hypothetical protein n=1 Tax=Vitreimonas sp. TaxID=3069702 RepID=UPI002D4C1E84|nr:hypothetical protein [Vitreimonas sp.]HYD87103.1 hypothetical protein [Vitreimonas sp.]
MKRLCLALALAPAFLLTACATDGMDTGGAGGAADQPLDADVAELEREVQKAVDRNVRAREELAASNAELDAVEAKIADGAQKALDFLRAYRNPVTPNPAEPIAPDVAAPAPAAEPPVFTDVASPELTPETTSGGFAETIGETFVVPAEVSGEASAETGAG